MKFQKLVSFSLLILLILFTNLGCSSNSDESINTTVVEETNDNSIDNTEQVSSLENTENHSISDAELHFISTGNSDAILIEQGGKFALIDAGDNDDESTVVNYLKEQGVDELEYLIATHHHADHIGGLDAVVNNFKINNALVSNGEVTSKTYKDFINAMSSKGVYPSVPLLGSKFNLGTSVFEVLSVANTNDPNNNSIVLLWKNGKDSVLLMGDAEAEIEAKLNVGKVDLLKVGHHGSHSSSTPSFIDKVNPTYAVIQVGANNKYGHPHKETMDTLKSRGIKVHRNDECGTIIFKSSGGGLTVDCKEGSYNSPNGKTSSASSSSDSSNVSNYVPSLYSGDSSSDNQYNSVGSGTVYWTTNGKKYHYNPNCSKMKNPSSGTIEQSGRQPCSKCA